LVVSFDKLQAGATSAKVNRFTYLHVEASGGAISKCLIPSEMSSESLVNRFCKDVDPKENESCEDNLLNLTVDVKEHYCGKGHPFLKFDAASGKCLPLDAGKACASGFIQGYNAAGELECYVLPPRTPTVNPVCLAWSNWSPASTNACPSASVTQTRSCTNGPGSQTRTVTGTKTGKDCCTSWTNWTPSSDTKCGGQTVTQTRTCQSGWSGTDSRTVSGTKPTGAWLPSVADVCSDKDVVQS